MCALVSFHSWCSQAARLHWAEAADLALASTQKMAGTCSQLLCLLNLSPPVRGLKLMHGGVRSETAHSRLVEQMLKVFGLR